MSAPGMGKREGARQIKREGFKCGFQQENTAKAIKAAVLPVAVTYLGEPVAAA